MIVSNIRLDRWRRTTRLAMYLLLSSALWMVTAQAQDSGTSLPLDSPTPPYALFQYSTLTGAGNAVVASWVPVVTTHGTVYKNVTLLFAADDSGNLTLVPGYPQVGPAPAVLIANFKAGKYVGPSVILSGQAMITVSGPGVAPGGATEWAIAAATGAAGCTYPSTATWYVGPLATSPIVARIQKAGITSTAWSYGVGGSQCSTGLAWLADSLLGFSQVGNTITIVSFTHNGTDQAQPVDQITYTLTK
jgi:hypothetical protein